MPKVKRTTLEALSGMLLEVEAEKVAPRNIACHSVAVWLVGMNIEFPHVVEEKVDIVRLSPGAQLAIMATLALDIATLDSTAAVGHTITFVCSLLN